MGDAYTIIEVAPAKFNRRQNHPRALPDIVNIFVPFKKGSHEASSGTDRESKRNTVLPAPGNSRRS